MSAVPCVVYYNNAKPLHLTSAGCRYLQAGGGVGLVVAAAATVPAVRRGGGPVGRAGLLGAAVAGRRLGCHGTGEYFGLVLGNLEAP